MIESADRGDSARQGWTHEADLLGGQRIDIEMTVIRQRTEIIDYYRRRGYSPTGEERPFPMGDERFNLPKTSDLAFVVLARNITTG